MAILLELGLWCASVIFSPCLGTVEIYKRLNVSNLSFLSESKGICSLTYSRFKQYIL